MGWDGKPEESEPAATAQTETPPEAGSQIQFQTEESQAHFQTEEHASDIDPFSPFGAPMDSPLDPPPLNPLPGFAPAPPEENLTESEVVSDFMSTPPQDPASAVLEIERFSNQSQEASALSYDLIIRGIDLPKQVQIVREAIQDSRFGWDSNQMLGKISQGSLVIKGLNPIKASLLVQRMRYSELEIQWVQNVLT